MRAAALACVLALAGCAMFQQDASGHTPASGMLGAVSSAVNGGCESPCEEGYVCNARTHDCERRPCDGACGPDEYCHELPDGDVCRKVVEPAASHLVAP